MSATPTTPWRLETRRAEGGPWAPVIETDDLGLARDEALARGLAADAGDLLRLRPPQGAARPRKVALWVVPPGGGLADVGAAPGGPGTDWETYWEGPDVRASVMLRHLRGLDPRLLAGGALACAATVRDLVPAAEPLPGRALDVAERWVRGRADGRELKVASDAVFARLEAAEITWGARVGRAAGAASSASIVGLAIMDLDAPIHASNAAVDAAWAACMAARATSFDRADADLAAVVRARLPLSALLLGVAASPWKRRS